MKYISLSRKCIYREEERLNNKIKEKIIKWIFENHEHHQNKKCDDSCFPYVNSIELEKFIKLL